jgi:hypothetical protein
MFASPPSNSVFRVSSAAEWPAVVFVLNGTVPPGQVVTWKWRIEWHSFSRSGVASTTTNQWDAREAIAGLGGWLTVEASGPAGTHSIKVKLAGTNPTAEELLLHLANTPESAGFDRILTHETRMEHFDPQGDPKCSFDKGYGMCQLTNPVPSYEQCWNWKLNVNCGVALFAEKRRSAMRYLSQNGRTFSDEQLRRESVSRWNGGAYHVWSAEQNKWIRNPAILCDTQTHNIGWDLTNPANRGKDEAALHKRDALKYRHKPGPADAWGYFGVCYADRILA